MQITPCLELDALWHHSVVHNRDWSRTIFLRGDDEDYTMTTRGRMMERLQVILAGRAAEEIAFTTPSSYSINDLKVCLPCCPNTAV